MSHGWVGGGLGPTGASALFQVATVAGWLAQKGVSMSRSMITLALCCSLVGGAAVNAGDATKKDLEAIQGTWRMVEVVDRGVKRAPDKGVVLVFAGDRWQLKTQVGVDKQGTFKLDPTKTPKVIVIYEDGKPSYAIYSLEKKTLKLCSFARAKDGKSTPSDFTSTKENRQALATYQRQKQ
jgi:uncharacterized protein (TIGR03067 family)